MALAFAVGSQLPTVTLERVLPGPDANVFFASVSHAAAGPDGTIHVVDGLNKTVYRFTPGGELLDSLGRSGRGPGELLFPSFVAVSPNGWIAVPDIPNRRITIWRADGQLHTTIRSPAQVVGIWWPEAGLVLKTYRVLAGPVPVVFWELRGDTAFQPIIEFDTGYLPDGTPEGATCAYCASAVGPGREIVIARPDTLFRLLEVGPDGSVGREWTRPGLRRVPRSTAELDAIRAGFRRAAAVTPDRPQRFDEERFRLKPVMGQAAFDERGRLWVYRPVPDGDPVALDVFAPDGRFLGTVLLDASVLRVAVGYGRVLGIAESLDGEPVVLVYRIGR